MSHDFVIGMLAGGGWGLFIGGILGSLWLMHLISDDKEDDDEPGTDW